MKIGQIANKKVISTFICCMSFLLVLSCTLSQVNFNNTSNLYASVSEANSIDYVIDDNTEITKDSNLNKKVIVYDGMTIDELGDKLNRSMTSTLSGYGKFFASYCLEKGVDPYVALSIALLETGCKWDCSKLTKQCNNIGGQKGSPSCNGGSYQAFPTLEDGIRGFIDNLANNYYAKGLNTPELMNSKYAESGAWAMKVNNYMNQVRAR